MNINKSTGIQHVERVPYPEHHRGPCVAVGLAPFYCVLQYRTQQYNRMRFIRPTSLIT